MGALHDGHLALIAASLSENDYTICSIFVNPTQFDNPEDLVQYPRLLEQDCAKLEAQGCDIVFAPAADEIYAPEEVKHAVDYGPLTHSLEGEFRPGHFDGVVQIVRKLLQAVGPTRAYFGKKDFQQLAVIRHMVATEAMPVDIRSVATHRHSSGLARSSRNLRLSEEGREIAATISKVMQEMVDTADQFSPDELCAKGTAKLLEVGIEPEYLRIADEITFAPVRMWEDSEQLRIFFAGWLEGIRLIDNKGMSEVEASRDSMER